MGGVGFGAGVAVAEVPQQAVGVAREVFEEGGVLVGGEAEIRIGGRADEDELLLFEGVGAHLIDDDELDVVGADAVVGHHDGVRVGGIGVGALENPDEGVHVVEALIDESDFELVAAPSGVGAELRNGQGGDDDLLGVSGVSAGVAGGEGDGVGSVVFVNVDGVIQGGGVAVAEVPAMAVFVGGQVGEGDGVLVDAELEVGSGHVVHDDEVLEDELIAHAHHVEDGEFDVVGAGCRVDDVGVGVVGVGGYTSGEFPAPGHGVDGRLVLEMNGQGSAAGGDVGGEVGGGRDDDEDQGGEICGTALVGGGQGHQVVAVIGEGVHRVHFGAGAAVAEIPGEAVRIAGRGVDEADFPAVGDEGEIGLGRSFHRDESWFGDGIAAQGVGDGQGDVVHAGGVVHDGGVLLGGGAGISAGEGPVPGGGLVEAVVLEVDGQRGTTRGDVGGEVGDGGSRGRAGHQAAAAGDAGHKGIDLTDGLRRPVVGVVHRRGHDKGAAGGVVGGAEVVPHLVGDEHALQAGVAGEILQGVIAVADGSQLGDADRGAAEVPRRPDFPDVVREGETRRGPGGETAQQGRGTVGGGPGVGSRGRHHELLGNGEGNFIGEFVVVVGLRQGQDGGVVRFHRPHRAIGIEHRQVGSDGDFHLPAVHGAVLGLGFVGFFFLLSKLLDVIGPTQQTLPGFHLGGGVHDHLILRGSVDEPPHRLDEVGLSGLFNHAMEQVFIQTEDDVAALRLLQLPLESDVLAARHLLGAFVGEHGQHVIRAANVIRVDAEGPIVLLPEPKAEFHLRTGFFDIFVQLGDIHFVEVIALELLVQFWVLGGERFAAKHSVLSGEGKGKGQECKQRKKLPFHKPYGFRMRSYDDDSRQIGFRKGLPRKGFSSSLRAEPMR